jgi:hypothetical protein
MGLSKICIQHHPHKYMLTHLCHPTRRETKPLRTSCFGIQGQERVNCYGRHLMPQPCLEGLDVIGDSPILYYTASEKGPGGFGYGRMYYILHVSVWFRCSGYAVARQGRMAVLHADTMDCKWILDSDHDSCDMACRRHFIPTRGK